MIWLSAELLRSATAIWRRVTALALIQSKWEILFLLYQQSIHEKSFFYRSLRLRRSLPPKHVALILNSSTIRRSSSRWSSATTTKEFVRPSASTDRRRITIKRCTKRLWNIPENRIPAVIRWVWWNKRIIRKNLKIFAMFKFERLWYFFQLLKITGLKEIFWTAWLICHYIDIFLFINNQSPGFRIIVSSECREGDNLGDRKEIGWRSVILNFKFSIHCSVSKVKLRESSCTWHFNLTWLNCASETCSRYSNQRLAGFIISLRKCWFNYFNIQYIEYLLICHSHRT